MLWLEHFGDEKIIRENCSQGDHRITFGMKMLWKNCTHERIFFIYSETSTKVSRFSMLHFNETVELWCVTDLVTVGLLIFLDLYTIV